ncbi:hypothetical protein BDN70DRAFT_194076 [Pholiota conissans]|uniref:Uncharacterized protein n=1 Tax=Pholiota conissans TaxID=109636 RepID=A0A9P5YWX2_9AGAR|nr:hypothetical protein BDN70DRAFT_194076 [Pholiota conissans]
MMGYLHGVHGMIELAFESRANATQYCHARRDLYLPAFPWKITADVITYAGVPCDWADSLFGYPNYYTFSTDEHFRMLVTFVCMADSVSNFDDVMHARRRLALALCSAQHQRRALGFPDRSVFGATLVGTKLSIFEAEWDARIGPNYVIMHPPIGTFTLSNFLDFIFCYIILCKIANVTAQLVDDVYAKWKTEAGRKEMEEKSEAASRTPWRRSLCPERRRQLCGREVNRLINPPF